PLTGLCSSRAESSSDTKGAAPPSMKWMYAMLVFVPISIGLKFAGANPTLVFVTSALAIIPLAGIMGTATEELAKHLGSSIGGLLNATFGNAAELIITIIAL